MSTIPTPDEKDERARCLDLFHSQLCSGFGAPEFCGTCGGTWKHSDPDWLGTKPGTKYEPPRYPETFEEEAERLEAEEEPERFGHESDH